MPDKCIYIVDTSSWLLVSKHSKSNRILYLLTNLLNEGRLKSRSQVFDELNRVEPLVSSWLTINKGEIIENQKTDLDYIRCVNEISDAFPSMVGVRKNKEKADPHVIALALSGVLDVPVCIVVCEETTAKRPNRKIPTACQAFGIKAFGIMEMLRSEIPNEEWG